MNKSLIYLLLFLALSACSDAERFDTEQQQPSSRQALTLSVFASDFATYSDGALDTRATNNGATTFANGDRVGVIITDASGNLSADNIPYTYKDGSWAFDAANNEGKTPCYYDNKATTYIVYYPYSPKADGITTADALKAKFKPLFNQSTEADYSASDLLLWVDDTSTVPLKNLSANLAHAYASVSIVPKVKYTLANNTELDFSSSISNVSFAIGDDIFVPRKATDGSYCCIFPVSTSNVDIRYVYTYIDEAGIGKIVRGTLASSATAANTRYTSTSTYSETYTFADAKLGDFYCKDDAGKAYLIPGDVTTELTTEQQTACLGIVYWVGDITGDNYGLLSKGTHGLVACKQVLTDPDATNKQTMYWTYGGDNSVNAWLATGAWTGSTRPPGFTSIRVEDNPDKMQGYANTVALQEYNNAMELESSTIVQRVKPIYALATFANNNSAPTSSSGWYWPSVTELKMMCWGQGNNTQSIVGRDMLNRQFQKVGGLSFSGGYWSSTESIDDNRARGVNFNDGGASGGIKGHTELEHLVRPVLAF